MENKFGSEYAFGVLRCAVDDANADNVETISFPSGYKNVFCYAYYVNPAPEAGTITIRKAVAGSGVTQGFTFDSDLTYDPSGQFSLQVSNGGAASASFTRADSASLGSPYDTREEVPAGWTLTSLTCSDTANGASTWTIDKAAASVSVHLAGNDHVTCTWPTAPGWRTRWCRPPTRRRGRGGSSPTTAAPASRGTRSRSCAWSRCPQRTRSPSAWPPTRSCPRNRSHRCRRHPRSCRLSQSPADRRVSGRPTAAGASRRRPARPRERPLM
jgi:hypothetical protein